MTRHQRLAAFIRSRLNAWARWQPVVKFSGHCADVTDGLWIADDGSTDGISQDVLAGYDEHPQFTIIRRRRNIGFLRNVNAVLRRCRGEFVAILSADDRWLPDMLTCTVRALRDYPQAGIAHGRFFTIDAAGTRIREPTAAALRSVDPAPASSRSGRPRRVGRVAGLGPSTATSSSNARSTRGLRRTRATTSANTSS